MIDKLRARGLTQLTAASQMLQRKFVKDTLMLQVASVLQMATVIFTSAIIARSLGAENFGKYALVFTFHSTLFSFVLFGISRGAMALYSEAWMNHRHDEKQLVLAFYFKMFVLVNLVAGFLGFHFSSQLAEYLYSDGSVGEAARWLFYNQFILIFYALVCLVFQATRMVKQLAYCEAVTNILRNLVLAAVAFTGGGVFELVRAYLLVSIVASAAGFFLYLKYSLSGHAAFPSLIHILPKAPLAPVKKYIGVGVKIRVGKVIPEWALLLPQNLLGMYAPVETVGFFRLAMNLIKLPQFLFSAVSRNVLAKYYEVSAKEGLNGISRVYKKLTAIGGMLSLSLYALFFVLLVPLVDFIYGDDFSTVVSISQILIVSMLFTGFVVGAQQVFIAINRQWVYIACTVIPFILLSWICFILTEQYGAIGAAIYIVMLDLSSNALKYIFAKRELRRALAV